MLEAQSAQQNCNHIDEKEQQSNKRHPLVIALMTIMFTLPICTGSALLHYLFYFCFFIFFIGYVFFQTRQYKFSLFHELKQRHNVIWCLIVALGFFSLISYLNVILGDADEFRKMMASFRYVLYLTLFAYAFALARFSLVNGLPYKNLFIAYMLGNIALYLFFILVNNFVDGATNLPWGIDPPFGRHVRLISMGIEVAVVTAVVLFLLGKNSLRENGLLWFCMLACAAFLMTTGSRASMLSALLTILLLMMLGRLIDKKISYLKIGMVIMSMVLSLWVAEIFPIHSWNGVHRAIEVSTVPVVNNEDASAYAVADRLSSGRLLVWREAINAIKLSPLIGLGPNASIFFVKAPYAHDQPHNFILQFLIEWGVIGAGLLIAILVSFAWHGIKNIPRAIRQGNTDYIIAASVVFILTLNGLADGTYYHVQPIICLATAFAVFPFFADRNRTISGAG
jgi:O-antigen ligase